MTTPDTEFASVIRAAIQSTAARYLQRDTVPVTAGAPPMTIAAEVGVALAQICLAGAPETPAQGATAAVLQRWYANRPAAERGEGAAMELDGKLLKALPTELANAYEAVQRLNPNYGPESAMAATLVGRLAEMDPSQRFEQINALREQQSRVLEAATGRSAAAAAAGVTAAVPAAAAVRQAVEDLANNLAAAQHPGDVPPPPWRGMPRPTQRHHSSVSQTTAAVCDALAGKESMAPVVGRQSGSRVSQVDRPLGTPRHVTPAAGTRRPGGRSRGRS